MEDMNCRSAMALGLTVAAATPLVALATPAAAAMYSLEDGKEIMPGVRQVIISVCGDLRRLREGVGKRLHLRPGGGRAILGYA